MTRRNRMLFIAIVVVQVLVIVGMAAGREMTLRTGDEVTLQTAPVDPRDLLRGDYVVLQYEISTIQGFDVIRLNTKPGDTVYVRLAEHNGVWVEDGIGRRPFDEFDTMIRGTVTRVSHDQMWVEYGIEQYFVPEGRGHEIQRARDVDVAVALDDNGGAVIRDLIVDGEVWDPYD